jgi:hypothetical protein
MKITSFYYLEYPDCCPVDPLRAASEVYVEVASHDGSIESFDYTYAITVCTLGFLREYLETHPYYCARGVVIVERFEDETIKQTLQAILPNIDEVATRK